MDFASALGLCDELSDEAAAITVVIPGGPGGLGAVETEAARGISYGVARGARPGTFVVAIRVSSPNAITFKLAEQAQGRAHGEFDYAIVSPLDLGPTSPILRSTSSPYQRGVRPLHPGLSVGHPSTTAGTIGAFVRDKGNRPCILSNCHVLAPSEEARRGDPTLQPGPRDGGGPNDAVGHLDLASIGGRVDAALAVLKPEIGFETAFAGRRLGGVRPPEIGAPVWKVGRTTGVTKGVIHAMIRSVALTGTPYVLVDQWEVRSHEGDRTDFSDGGDSGALILSEGDDMAVGLLFANNANTGERPRLTYMNDIRAVLAKLEATFIL